MSSLIKQLQPDIYRLDFDPKDGFAKPVIGPVRRETVDAVQAIVAKNFRGLGARIAAMRGDTAGGLALERELTKISAVQSLEPLSRLTSLAVFGTTPDSPMPGQKAYTSTGISQTGNRLSYSYTDQGGSAVNDRAELITNKILPIIQFADYTLDDLYAAQLANVPFPELQMQTARRLVEEEANRWCFLGDTTLGITGLYNMPGVTPSTVANGGSGSPLWANKTPDEIFEDVVAMVQSVWAAIEGGDTNVRGQASILMPNRLIISSTSYFELVSRFSAANWAQTILQRLQQALGAAIPDFQIVPAPELNSGGGGSGRWMACFSDNSQVVGRVVALPGQFGIPTVESFKTAIPYHTQVGGLQSRFPVGIAIRFGM